ncbi:MAG: TlpA disulfide reductase family protein [Bacteroidota bacterium]
MKTVFSVLVSLCPALILFSQASTFTITGDISSLKAPIEWVYLSYFSGSQRITDSALVKQETYHFTGTIDGPVQAGLRIGYKPDRVSKARIPFNSKRDYAIVFLEPGNMLVASIDSFANVTVSGSKADAEYRKLQELTRPFDDQLSDLYRQSAMARKSNDGETAKILEKQIDSIDAAANEQVYGVYAKNNPGSPLALYALKNWGGYTIDAGKLEPVFNTLPEATRNSVQGKDMLEKINIAKKTGVGQMALNFTQNDTLGRPVSLSSFQGKYLLLDFWASWCGPCRAENPSLVKVYLKYNGRGFQILSVSLDRPGAKSRWLQAIHDDGLRWTHVSDLLFWNNAVARQYGIEAIPQNLLLDPSGKIIAKNLQGEELDKKLATLYLN